MFLNILANAIPAKLQNLPVNLSIKSFTSVCIAPYYIKWYTTPKQSAKLTVCLGTWVQYGH